MCENSRSDLSDDDARRPRGRARYHHWTEMEAAGITAGMVGEENAYEESTDAGDGRPFVASTPAPRRGGGPSPRRGRGRGRGQVPNDDRGLGWF